MTATPSSVPASDERPPASGASLLFDLDDIDLSARIADRAEMERLLPHRHEMALLDGVIYLSDDGKRTVGFKDVRDDEFWCRGHFPGRPLLPGVLQVEAGAQLSCYAFNRRAGAQQLAVFLRIEHAAFRSSVVPGDTLHILCQEVKIGRRRFVTDIQGVVGRRVAFESRISGMVLEDKSASSG